MCKLTNEGYQLKSGKIIPFHNCKVEYLSSDEFQELSASKASILDTLLIRDALHSLRTDMQVIVNKIDMLCKNTKIGCPEDEGRVRSIVQEVINSQPKKMYNKVVELSKSLTVILLLIMNIILLYKQFFSVP